MAVVHAKIISNFQIPNSKFQSGFTLIELLTVLAVAAIILGLSIASYRNFQASEELKQASQTLKANLRLAQSQAFGGVKNCGTDTLIGWYVRFQSTAYEIHSRCGLNVVLFRQFSLPSGTTLSVSPAADVLFQPVNKEAVFLSDASTASPPFTSLASEMIITLTNSAGSFRVKARTTGDIYEEKVQ